jgi:hypothetical protein
MGYRQLTDLIPQGIAYYPTLEAYIGAVGTGAITNAARRPKPWRDNTLLYSTGFWWDMPSLEGTKQYRTFATDASGALLLTPIESAQAYETYSLTVINTYREYKDLFPSGVPYLVTIELPKSEASEFNYGGTGQPWGVPVVLNSDTIIAMDSDGKWKAIQYQEFVQKMKSNLATPEAMFDTVDKIVQATKSQGRSKADAVTAMRRVLIAPPAQMPVI